MEEIDLYAVLEVQKGATKAEIKKAYHKAALANHPDKVAADDRSEADIKFKSISQAYEILQDEEKRHLYDTHGMAAFENGRGGPGSGVDMEDILQQMMFGMGGGGPPGFGGQKVRKPQKGKNEEQEYEVQLEDLYKGKSARFASTKNVICSHCKGKGGKENAKPKNCETCGGRGLRQALRSIAPGFVTQDTVVCDHCQGNGNVFKEKDKCKKCKGKKTISERKILEIYIPRGSKEGDKIVLEGEADQSPDQQPGDIIFNLTETPHQTFKRQGADLSASLRITLAESLCGFSRVVVKHLDGRGLLINHQLPDGQVLRPGQVIKIAGEGMPYKKSDMKGDLYLVVDVQFPGEGWLRDEKVVSELKKILPESKDIIQADTVDEVEYNPQANIEDFGASDGGQSGNAWVDEDDEEVEGHPQCATQ